MSHDEVIVVAYEMFKGYKKLCDILKSRYPFILIDEYQDTFPMVVEIMLDFFEAVRQKEYHRVSLEMLCSVFMIKVLAI